MCQKHSDCLDQGPHLVHPTETGLPSLSGCPCLNRKNRIRKLKKYVVYQIFSDDVCFAFFVCSTVRTNEHLIRSYTVKMLFWFLLFLLLIFVFVFLKHVSFTFVENEHFVPYRVHRKGLQTTNMYFV